MKAWWRRINGWPIVGLLMVLASWGIAWLVIQWISTLELLALVAMLFLAIVVEVLVQVCDLGRWWARTRGARKP